MTPGQQDAPSPPKKDKRDPGAAGRRATVPRPVNTAAFPGQIDGAGCRPDARRSPGSVWHRRPLPNDRDWRQIGGYTSGCRRLVDHAVRARAWNRAPGSRSALTSLVVCDVPSLRLDAPCGRAPCMTMPTGGFFAARRMLVMSSRDHRVTCAHRRADWVFASA